MTFILKHLAGAFGPYILGALIAAFAVLLLALGFQTNRLGAAQNALTACELATKEAAAASAVKGAETGVKAIENFTEKQNEDRPVVERVVTRVVRQCADRNLQVPAASQGATEADAEAGDAGDRAFAEAVGRDIANCSAALNQCDSILKFVCDNGGCSN